MFRTLYLFMLVFLFSCKTTTYYIVRHAEKEGASMMSDPPLTAEGEKQALDLKNFLEHKNIKAIYATNYARTLATAKQIRLTFNIDVKIYDPRKLNELVAELKQIRDGDVLVVGHSNTVDDVVNGLVGEEKIKDLNDDEYRNVFMVRKKGNSYSFERMKVPQTAKRN